MKKVKNTKENYTTQDKILREVARRYYDGTTTWEEVREIKKIQRIMQDVIYDTLTNNVKECHTKDNPYKIKLFSGFTIEAVYRPSCDKSINYLKDKDGKIIVKKMSQRIKVKVKVTDRYNKKVSESIFIE